MSGKWCPRNSVFQADPLWQTFLLIFMFCLYESRTSPPSRDLALQNYDRQAVFPLHVNTILIRLARLPCRLASQSSALHVVVDVVLYIYHLSVECARSRRARSSTNKQLHRRMASFVRSLSCHHTPDDPSISREVGQGTSQQRTSPRASACPHSSAATKKEVPVGESETE